MKRLFIANRGEIAARIARTARDRALPSVVAVAPEDEQLRYHCDATAPLRSAASYADSDELIAAALREGCDAVHPGYGFLSEDAAFSRNVRDAGLTFVGAPTAALEVFGDKIAARRLAVDAGVPVARGAVVGDAAALEAFLKDGIGAGVLKARAGGGGRGIRRVSLGGDLAADFERCASEASRSFGGAEEGLLVEDHVWSARHVEVQVAADNCGAVATLFDRECSLQRRHQKLIEVAPAPFLDDTLRRLIAEAAKALAASSGLQGLGTFEFLINGDRFYFMECNPRLQVEHTVTEEIAGVDLVAVQLALAEGAALDDALRGRAAAPRGFSVQARVLAEKNGKPSCEPARKFNPPTNGVRVETALAEGLGTHPSFDSLVAKVIVNAPTYERALDKARRAVDDFGIEGPSTNLRFLSELLSRPEVLDATATTTFVDDAFPDDEAAALADETAALGDDGDGALRSPTAGTVVSVAAVGEIARGKPVVVIEAMKMEHVLAAPADGEVVAVRCAVGDVVSEGSVLAEVAVAAGAEAAGAEAAVIVDLDAPRPDLAALRSRLALLDDAARPEAVARRRKRGQLTAREHIFALCGESFKELGGLAVAAQRRTRGEEELAAKTPADGVLTGVGIVGDAPAVVVAVDATVLAGTQGFFHHHKLDRAVQVAAKRRLPIIALPEGGGGRPNDGDVEGLMAAGLFISTWHAYAALAGVVPRVAVVSGYCFAGSAAIAGCSDVVIATETSSLGMGGPAMIEGGGLGRVKPEDVGPAPALAERGVVDVVAADDAAALDAAKRYLSYFAAPVAPPAPAGGDQRLLRRLVPENRKRAYDMRAILDVVCDEGSVFELRDRFGRSVITALARVDGRAVGILASDPARNGGAVDADAADKAARFLRLCDAFGLPVVSLLDCPGFMVGPDAERDGMVRKASRLFLAGAKLSVPVVAVVVRKAVGLGAMALCGGSTKVPVDTIAFPTAEIGAMGVEGAVSLGFKAKLDAVDGAERAALFDKLCAAVHARGAATTAASQLEVDDVVDPAETRDRIVAALAGYEPPPPKDGGLDAW